MCKPSFYYDNNLWVDWIRGDCNHLSTIFCVNNNLNFEHLPGYFEIGGDERTYWSEKLNVDPFHEPNPHIWKDNVFIYHLQGGTGLNNFNKKNYDFTDSR
jgi:hypothetical protein